MSALKNTLLFMRKTVLRSFILQSSRYFKTFLLAAVTLGTINSYAGTPVSGTTNFNSLYTNAFVDLTGIHPAGSTGLSALNVAGYDFTVFSSNNASDAGIGIEPYTGQTAIVYGYTQSGGTVITALEVKSNGLPLFDLNTIDISIDGAPSNGIASVTLTGYRNNVAVSGATMTTSLSTASNGDPLTTYNVSSNNAFKGIDKIRITATGITVGAIGVDNINATNFAAPLPLVMTSFSGRQVGTQVQLDWLTTDESGMKIFNVQRSVDGKRFSTIGSLPAGKAGAHQFMDEAINGKIYYRLETIGDDNSTIYSKVISVQVQTGAQISIAPNPVLNKATVYSLPQGTVHYQLVDAAGRCVLQGHKMVSAAGQLSLDLSGQASGSYHLLISGDAVAPQSLNLVKP